MIRARCMQAADLPVVHELCRQLGYENDYSALEARFAQFARHSEHAFFVAGQAEPLGFLHLRVSESFVRESGVEVAALVVHEKSRGIGIGRILMQAAEDWAAAHGFTTIFLRSRDSREEAHRFYERLGYSNQKRSLGFLKKI